MKIYLEDESEIIVFVVVGWEEKDGAVTHWKFKTNMNDNWYLDGCLDIPVDSPLIVSFKALSFQAFA